MCGVWPGLLRETLIFAAISLVGREGSSFFVSAARTDLLFPALSEPDAGGVGGKARFGGGDGNGGGSSFIGAGAGLLGREGVLDPPTRLRLFMADRGIEADRGRGVYVFPSLTITFAGLCERSIFGIGTSSATSINGLKLIIDPAFALALDVAGEIGVWAVLSTLATCF